jgi:hypothetical protein
MGQEILASSSTSVVSLPVTNSVTLGDYFYEWGNGSTGWPKSTNISYGQVRNVAAANRTFEIFTATGRASSAGPLVDTGIYSGSTVAVNTVTTASATLQAFAGYTAKVATLTNGNFVSVYMSAANTLSAKIFDAAGAQVGSTLSISTTVTTAAATLFTGTSGTFSVAGLSTGGYVVIFKHSSLNTIHIATVSAANAIVSGPTELNAAVSVSTCTPMTVAADNNGGYLIAFYTAGSTSVRSAYYNSANTYVGGMVSAVTGATYATGGTTAIFPQAFVLNNGAMGIASNITGNETCVGNGNWTVISSLNSTASATTNYVVDSPVHNSSASGAVSVAGSAATPNTGLYITTIDSGTHAMGLRLFTISSAGGAVSSVASTTLTTAVRASKQEIIANPDGSYVVLWKESASVTRRQNFSAGGAFVGSAVTIDSATTMDYVSACPLANKAAVALTPTATNYPSQLIFQTDGITNGQAVIGTTVYTPTTGYYLKGIALETVSAGSPCKVGVVGTFALGASYPSASVAFDYIGTTRSGASPVKGNAGSVTTTNVTLQGLK